MSVESDSVRTAFLHNYPNLPDLRRAVVGVAAILPTLLVRQRVGPTTNYEIGSTLDRWQICSFNGTSSPDGAGIQRTTVHILDIENRAPLRDTDERSIAGALVLKTVVFGTDPRPLSATERILDTDALQAFDEARPGPDEIDGMSAVHYFGTRALVGELAAFIGGHGLQNDINPRLRGAAPSGENL